MGKSGKFTKKIFYFLKAGKKCFCKISADGKAVKADDGLGMKVFIFL